jgi:hypothetical protein
MLREGRGSFFSPSSLFWEEKTGDGENSAYYPSYVEKNVGK